MKKTGSPALLMVPAAVEPMLAFGGLNCGVFGTLKISVRNSRWRSGLASSP